MSTKINLISGDGYKVYRQCFDDENIYLQLTDVEVMKSDNTHIIVIPNWMWENIKKANSLTDLSLINLSDEEIMKKTTEEVDSRIKELSLFGKEDNMAKLINMEKYVVFGDSKSPRDEQIKKGMSFYLKQRDRQKDLSLKIKKD